MALNRRPWVQSDLADIIKTGFLLGPIGPRAVGSGGGKRAVGERVNFFKNYQ
jgi:hypothetical protein